MRSILLLPLTSLVSVAVASVPEQLTRHADSRSRQTFVVDSADGTAIPQVSVFNSKGTLIGFGNDKGRLPYVSEWDYPLSIRCMGYDPIYVSEPGTDTLRMNATTYMLPEVSVGTDSRTVLYLKGFVREYSTLTAYSDTLFMFREKQVDFMVPSSRARHVKGWTTPRLLKNKSYYRFSDDRSKDSVSNYYRQNFSWADWISIRPSVSFPATLQDVESGSDTIKGRYGNATIWQRNGDDMRADINVLADSANYKWIPELAIFLRKPTDKLDFTNFRISYRYCDVGGSALWADNIASIGVDIESYGRGRQLFRIANKNVPYYISTHAEIYITDREYITEKQAKSISKNLAIATLELDENPSSVPPIPQEMKTLVARVDNIDHDDVRKSQELDNMLSPYGKIVQHKHGPIIGTFNAVKNFFKKKFGF